MKGRTLGQRYWHALIDSRPFEADERMVRSYRGASLWQRYRAELLGLPPPPPSQAPNTARSSAPTTAPGTASTTVTGAGTALTAATAPATAPVTGVRRRRRRGAWGLTFNVAVAMSVTALAFMVGVAVFRLPDPQVAGQGNTTASPATTPSERRLYRDTMRLPVPEAAGRTDYWKLTPVGASRSGAAEADFAVAGEGSRIYVDGTRTFTSASLANCLAGAPPATGTGKRWSRLAQPYCIRTRPGEVAYVSFGEPAGGTVTVRIDLWAVR
ncbi:hypothetical protein AB0I81_35700 [Nonomuraea sp. NPDC050404]|uniref:hypothetical protein n=1 Tax=Nonomuraea sp. NPDC050404 TaxID=3155783 RepID=UPI00340868A2